MQPEVIFPTGGKIRWQDRPTRGSVRPGWGARIPASRGRRRSPARRATPPTPVGPTSPTRRWSPARSPAGASPASISPPPAPCRASSASSRTASSPGRSGRSSTSWRGATPTAAPAPRVGRRGLCGPDRRLVVAEGVEAAREAADRVVVHYEPAPFADGFDAEHAETVRLADLKSEHHDPACGDADAGLTQADRVVAAHYETPIQHHNPIELFHHHLRLGRGPAHGARAVALHRRGPARAGGATRPGSRRHPRGRRAHRRAFRFEAGARAVHRPVALAAKALGRPVALVRAGARGSPSPTTVPRPATASAWGRPATGASRPSSTRRR